VYQVRLEKVVFTTKRTLKSSLEEGHFDLRGQAPFRPGGDQEKKRKNIFW